MAAAACCAKCCAMCPTMWIMHAWSSHVASCIWHHACSASRSPACLLACMHGPRQSHELPATAGLRTAPGPRRAWPPSFPPRSAGGYGRRSMSTRPHSASRCASADAVTCMHAWDGMGCTVACMRLMWVHARCMRMHASGGARRLASTPGAIGHTAILMPVNYARHIRN